RGGGSGRGRCSDCRRRRRWVDGADLDPVGAIAQHVELRGGRVREIDDSIAYEGTAVVDPDHDTAAVLQIGDAHVRGQRERLVSSRHAVHVVGLADRGPRLVETGPVPGGDAALPGADARGQDVVAFAEHIVKRRIAAARARFDPRDDLRNGVRFRRRGRRYRRGGGGGRGGR